MPYLYEAYMKHKYGTTSGMNGNNMVEQDEPLQQDPHNPTEFLISVLGLSGKYLPEGFDMTLRLLYRLQVIAGLTPPSSPSPLP